MEVAVQRANIVITVMGLTLMVVAGLLAAGAIDTGMLLTGVALAVAVFGPTPLIFDSRRQVSLERNTFSISLSNHAI